MILWLNHLLNPAQIAAIVPMYAYQGGGALAEVHVHFPGNDRRLQIACTAADYDQLKGLLDLGWPPGTTFAPRPAPPPQPPTVP